MIAELWNKKQFLKVKYYISYTLKLSLLVGIPTLIMVIFLSKYLIIWFSTPLFISAKIVIIFVAIAFFINGIGVVGECFITATKSTGLIMAIYSFLLFFNVAANFIFIKRFGISGAAMVTLLTYSLYTLLIFYFVQKKIYIRFKAREFFKYLLAASPLIATGIYFSIFRFNPSFFIWPIALSLILYILMLINLRLITKYDINLLRGVLVS
jgi:O-antigen/teichoic acid export membrane protein